MIKVALLTVLATYTLSAASMYGDSYSLTQKEQSAGAVKKEFIGNKNLNGNFFLGDYFTKIIRYEPILFDGSTMDSNAQKTIDKIVEDMKAQDLNRSRITVIGYTDESDNPDAERSVKANSFVAFFQSVATHKGAAQDDDVKLSAKRADKVVQTLVDQDVSKELIYKEERGGEDMLYTEGTSEGRKLNNRVEIALYVIGDEDGDGVLDPYDLCLGTFPGLFVDAYGCPGSVNLQVNFKLDSSEVAGDNNVDVDNFATFLIENPPYDAKIVGHTDKQGRAAYNMKLSERRAQTVVDMLVERGVAKERLTMEGRGYTEPLIDEATPEAYAKNRRIEAHYRIRESAKLKEKKEAPLPKLRQEPEAQK